MDYFTAENELYRYEVEETKQDETRERVTLNVTRKAESGDQHCGYISLQSGQKSTTFPESEDIRTHIDVFEEFLSGQTEGAAKATKATTKK